MRTSLVPNVSKSRYIYIYIYLYIWIHNTMVHNFEFFTHQPESRSFLEMILLGWGDPWGPYKCWKTVDPKHSIYPYGSNHLLRMVMEPKYLSEMIIHPNHHLTRWARIPRVCIWGLLQIGKYGGSEASPFTSPARPCWAIHSLLSAVNVDLSDVLREHPTRWYEC